MVDRTAAGYAAYRSDLLSGCQGRINFLKRALVMADNDRRLVDVKQHVFAADIQIAVAILFQGQIDGGVGYVVVVD
jgi:hypothetical protein